jgi:hypothetical protein
MDSSRFYNLLIEKLIVRLKADLEVQGTAAFYRFKYNGEKYILRYIYVSKTWYLQCKDFGDTDTKKIATTLAKLLGYEC